MFTNWSSTGHQGCGKHGYADIAPGYYASGDVVVCLGKELAASWEPHHNG